MWWHERVQLMAGVPNTHVFRGFLAKGGLKIGPIELSLARVGNENRKWARCEVPITKELREVLCNPMVSPLFEFQSECGAAFNLVAMSPVNVLAERVVLESSGKVPGL
jgi:hypothetical protein